jgi:hypothetical protein
MPKARATFRSPNVLLGGGAGGVSRNKLAAGPDVIASGEGFQCFRGIPTAATGQAGLRPDRRPATSEDVAEATQAKAFVAWWRVRRADGPDTYQRSILINTSNRGFRRQQVTEQPGDVPEPSRMGPTDQVGERAALLAALRHLPSR